MASNLTSIGATAAIAGGVMVFLGIKDYNLTAVSSKEPERISLKSLIVRGPDSNPNIILTDFAPCDNFVYETKNGRWNKAWVPIVPREDLAPGQMSGGKPQAVQAIMVSMKAHNQDELYNRVGQAAVRGLMLNRVESLGSQERNLLQESYPNTDFSRCLIIQEDRAPAGPTFLVIMISGGLVATIVGLGLLALAFYRWRVEEEAAKKRRRDAEDEDDAKERPSKRRRARAEEDEEEQAQPRRSRRAEDEGKRPPPLPRRRSPEA